MGKDQRNALGNSVREASSPEGAFDEAGPSPPRRGGTAAASTLGATLLIALAALGAAPRAPAPKAEAGPQRIQTTHFDVQSFLPPEDGKSYAALCERAYGRFCELLDVPQGEAVWDGKCVVMLFRTREQFVAFAAGVAGPNAAVSGGFSRPTKLNPLIALPMCGQERVRLEQLLIHEMSHVFLQLFRKEVQLPIWLHEGCAQFFEFRHHTADSRLKQSQRIVKDIVANGRARPLRQFWVTPFAATDREGYAQAWSLIHFLSQNPRTKGKIGKYVLKLKELAPERKGFVHIQSEADLKRFVQEAVEKAYALQAEAFGQVFGITVADLERDWRQFVLSNY